jgi:ParB family chromosome partitioning protein
VRQAEDLSRRDAIKPKKRKPEKDADTRSLEKSLSQALGLAVSIEHKAPGGSIKVVYRSLEQLELVAHLLSRKK